jgi:hypothetical protein
MDAKEKRSNAVCNYLRGCLSAFSGEAPGQSDAERAAALEVEADVSALLELYRQGRLPDPKAMLRNIHSLPDPHDPAPIHG